MATQTKKLANFKDRIRAARITKVDSQNKLVTVVYEGQDGFVPDINLSYQNVGLTWGRLYMPQIGDRVLIDNEMGEKPTIVGMKPTNTDFLPYLDPGELADMNSDGSFLHLRNNRRRVKSTGELIDYDATKGPSGETDIELEPGGIILGVRSKQDISTKAPRWYQHSYLSMYDNGDISLQSRFQSKERGLLFMDGASGYVILTAGDQRPQEYVELDPINKCITILTDGDTHHHNQNDWKITVYNNEVQNIGNALQINVGVEKSLIPGDFDLINPDVDLQQGDIRIQNALTKGPGRFFMHIKGDSDVILDQGNLNLSVLAGAANLFVQGALNATVNGGLNATVNGPISASATGVISVTSPSSIFITSPDVEIGT